MSGSRGFRVALVLSGGNALGAFQAGAYQALREAGLEPDWIVGASVGAINGALIAGNPPERRIERLTEFWRPAGGVGASTPWWQTAEDARRSSAVAWTMAAGRAGMFVPSLSGEAWWSADVAATTPALFRTPDLATTLTRLVDFDRLNTGEQRYAATAVDLASGEDVVFDSIRDTIGPDHVRASAALPVSFPAIAIDGRLLVDGGMSANLPLDPVLADPPDDPLLCIAVDLLPLGAPAPKTLGEVAGRMQDLIFAAQSRRSISRWQAAYAADTRLGTKSVTLMRVAYADQGAEVAGKAMDFSGPSVSRRWKAGFDATIRVVEAVTTGAARVGSPGLSVLELDAPQLG